MSNDEAPKVIHARTRSMDAFFENAKRAMAITPAINRLTFDDADEIRALFSELTGRKIDETFRLIPPFYTAYGLEIRVGKRVFINQNCTLYDLAEINIGDDVMIGPNVNIITAGHPVAQQNRAASLVARPITIERNVWIAAGATIIGGVTVGENSVVAAGSVVTRDVPPNTLVGGNPARVIRAVGDCDSAVVFHHSSTSPPRSNSSSGFALRKTLRCSCRRRP
jgi:acetyltransferase-like isoleucine patch superfamily enzyme